MPQNDGEVVIQIMGDNSEFANSLKETNRKMKDFGGEINEINKSLQFNPGNSELITQKYTVLGQQVAAVRERLDALKNAEAEITAMLGSGEINLSQYDAYRREILNTEAALRGLISAQEDVKTELTLTVAPKIDIPDIGTVLNEKISEVLNNSSVEINKLDEQLSQINKSLQLNPGNTELLAQKYTALGQQISAARNKLESLKNIEQQVNQSFSNGEIGTEQYDAYRRSVLNAEASLRQLIDAQNDMVDEAGNLRDVSKEVNNLDNAMDDAGKSAITFGDLLKSNIAGEFITEGLHKAAGAVKDFIGNGIELASNLQEVQNVVDVTFGDGAAQIYEWSDAAAESFGMSSLSAQKYTGTIGAMLKSMGLTDDAVLKMSTDMVGLAGDMASFYNLDVEQAFEKIRSGISGETEPLKQLGINMSVANLEAYALSQGIETAYEKMSQSEQATLRYNYLMAQTADAQGDFARTSDSFANQHRIFQLNIENLSASLGEKLLPHLNDVIVTLNDKLPKAERSIENIGEILGKVTSFALEHHEAILGLASAYLTYHGAMKAGKEISDIVGAFKNLTSATKTAKVAQEGMNAAAAANPYVILASALAALTVGLIAYSGSLDTVGNRIKDVNNEVENLHKNTEDSIAESEAEIAVIEDKAEKYEELREKVNRTAGEEEQLKKLAEELQQYMPEGTQLIDEQTGAFNSLADSIDSVTESMRRKATIAAYEDEYTELIKKQIKAEKNLKDAAEKMQELNDKGITGIKGGGTVFGLLGMVPDAMYAKARDDLNAARESYDEIAEQIAYTENKIGELRDEQAELADNKSGKYPETKYYLAVEGEENYKKLQEEKKIRDENLQNYVADLDKKLKLRRISEEQYYSDLKNHLDKYKDTESEVWFEQLERCEDYEQKKLEAAEKTAKENAKIAEDTAKKQEELSEKEVEDKISALKEKQLLNDDFTEEMMYDEMEIIISGLDKESDLYKKYNSEILKGRKKLNDKNQKLAEEQVKESKKSLEKVLEIYQKAYDELEKKRETYRKKLLSIGGDIFSVEETKDKNGNKTKTYTINDINEQIKKMKEYHANIKKLKSENKDISDGLLDKIVSMDPEDSTQFAKYLAGMSDAEFKKVNSLYKEKDDIAKELSKDMYTDEMQEIKNCMDRVEKTIESLSEETENIGAKAADGFIDGFTEEFECRYKELDELCSLLENSDYAAQIKATVETEVNKNSAAAFTAPAAKSTESVQAPTVKNPSLSEILEGLNKPIQIVLDGKIIAESVMQYQKNYSRKTGG